MKEGDDLIKELREDSSLPSSLKGRLCSYIKGVMVVALEGDQAKRDLHATHEAVRRR